MDLEQARKLKAQSNGRRESLTPIVSSEEHEDFVSLKERFQSIIDQVSQLDHEVPKNPRNDTQMSSIESRTVFIMRTEGPLPNVSLRFKYYTVNNDHLADEMRFSFFNQNGERVTGVSAEWIHAPDYLPDDPEQRYLSNDERLQYGKIFAEESVNDPAQRYHMVSTPNSFTLIEQSLDAYNEALRTQAAELEYFKE